MTVSYAANVATVGGLPSCFVKLLVKWRGSIYKIIYFDLIVFLLCYYSLNMTYRYALNNEQKEVFHDVVAYFSHYNSMIPLSFVLGFYVMIIVQRWSEQCMSLPWPDSTAVYVSTHIRGHDVRGRKMRRNVMRYINLSQIMVYTLISPKVKKRFPTYDHLVEVGVLVENEKTILKEIDEFYPKLPKYWMPIVWASSIFTNARKEGRIRDDYALRALNDSINEFRNLCVTLLHYDMISVPLVYTQTVSLAVYLYFFAACIGQQWTTRRDPDTTFTAVDYYFPLFTTLEFFFFMGWLKVAESLICPFGGDDDDFDINYMIDRNLMVSYLIVDEMHNRHPQLMKDQYWDEVFPYELQGEGNTPPEHSTARLNMSIARSTLTTAEHSDSRLRFLYKRRPSALRALRDGTDSDETDKEEIWSIVRSSIGMETSAATLKIEDEEEEESSGMTFEQLREERELKRDRRQRLKLKRTVENVADLTGEMKLRKRTSKDSTSKAETKEETEDDDVKKDKQDEHEKQQ